ncbi:MAG: hypothetical protein ABIN67_19625 [Ferruginibacter sp.]
MNAPTPPYLKSLNECLDKMVSEGFTENFTVDDNRLKALSSGKEYGPGDVHIKNFFRFEGQSDPDDNSIMYAIETTDGTKGTIVDAYGAYADPDISPFIIEVEKIQKKIPQL